MAASHGIGIAGHDIQFAVDTKQYLVVSHEVTNIVSDKVHLSIQAAKANTAIGRETRDIYADCEHDFSCAEIMACKAKRITA